MANPSRVKQESPKLWVPQSLAQAEDCIASIGTMQRQRQRLEADMNDQLAAIKRQFEAQAQPLGLEIKKLSQGLQIWADANRERLTGGKVKFAMLSSGKINWRTRPPKVNLRGKEKILEACKRLGLKRFIRTIEEIDKEAMLREQDVAGSIDGVTITQGEDFVVTPFETELEEVA